MPKRQHMAAPDEYRIFTIGHSTRPLDEFIALLNAHAVSCLTDVRTVPRSRHNPQYNMESLGASMSKVGVRYAHVPELGGFRRAKPDSPNGGWRNASFRGYADYMQTKPFLQHLDTLVEWSRTDRVALMCAEAVPWRCHRSLIADALVVRGLRVDEIVTVKRSQQHRLTSFAQVHSGTITYPPYE